MKKVIMFSLICLTTLVFTGQVIANVVPVASDCTITIDEDTQASIALTAYVNDADGDSLTLSIVEQPVKGNIAILGLVVTYTPGKNRSGQDSFVYQVSDGQVNSNLATATINITPVNDAPLAATTPVTMKITDGSVSVPLSWIEVDGDSVSISSVDSPGHGSLSGVPPNLTYTPNNGYAGLDSFTYTVTENTPEALSDTKEVVINVLDKNGWTVFNKSADTQVVYISSSGGDDTNNGLTELTPVKTIQKGKSLMRAGYPDWLLLKCGDTWVNESFGNWQLSGRAAGEPIVISSYGQGERPLLKIASTHGIRNNATAGNSTIKNFALTGIHFYAYKRDPSNPDYDQAAAQVSAVSWGQISQNLIFEDNLFDFAGTNAIQERINDLTENVQIRRNIVTNSYNTLSHSQGLFLYGIHGLLIEENLFDHNGWLVENGGQPAGGKTIYNHNIYMQANNSHAIVRGNIFSRASSHGIQLRPGGVLEDNLFLDNPLAISFGAILGNKESDSSRDQGVSGAILRNVILGSGNIGDDNIRGLAVQIANTNADGFEMADNIIAHDSSSSGINSIGILLSGNNGPAGVDFGIRQAFIHDNIVYDWMGSSFAVIGDTIRFSNVKISNNAFQKLFDNYNFKPFIEQENSSIDVAYANNIYYRDPSAGEREVSLDGNTGLTIDDWISLKDQTGTKEQITNYLNPDRSAITYNVLQNGEETFEAFINEVKKQSKQNWRTQYTASAVNAYIKQGFLRGVAIPVADFNAESTNGEAPLIVNFTEQSSNSPTSYLWDFGDGVTSKEKNPAHVYTCAGTYTVKLTATNAAGSGAEEKINYITVTIPKYTITALAGANGRISPSGATTLDSGLSQAYTIMPDIGYKVKDVLVDSVPVGVVSGYTFNNVTANHIIEASFGPIPTTPATPSNLTATAISRSQIALRWVDNSESETGFRIEKSTKPTSNFREVTKVGVNVTSYIDFCWRKGTTYYYRVRAYNTSGDSAYSNTASAATLKKYGGVK